MRLLVSVRSAAEASAAIEGGADIVDAKDPEAGALGAVSLEVLRKIRSAVAARRPVTAAIGDATDESTVERRARDFAAAGARFVKVGFAGIADTSRIVALAAAARRGVLAGAAGRAELVIAAYADADRAATLPPSAFIDIAVSAGARGVLLDTADKTGPGLRLLVDRRALTAWVSRAHEHKLCVALAGKLGAEDLSLVRDAGADIAGVRGAACDDGRTGRVSADRVRRLCASRAEAVPQLQR
jgi:(5-formylfuran-3-yl)methyl phosphate synthase